MSLSSKKDLIQKTLLTISEDEFSLTVTVSVLIETHRQTGLNENQNCHSK